MEKKQETQDEVPDEAEQFAIGDRVWVNGIKPGKIQYIGETQFAPGEWVGVMLDEPVGKNDGSVAGVRYFHCKSKHGVFARSHRLARECLNSSKQGEGMISSNLLSTSRNSLSGSKTIVSSGKTGAPFSSASSTKSGSSRANVSIPKFKVGDCVIVNATSGVKNGVLRYLGATDFAAGEWAGVELDEPVGKNDGSVAGKRYFECKMKYGLFAPLHKVSKAGGAISVSHASPTGSMPLSSRHAGSYESLNSSVSSTSSTARARVKLGVTALTSTQKSTHSAATSVMATNAALQEALKEKEEHIEQLLKERDIERAEVARAAARADEAEQHYVQLQAEFNRILEESEQESFRLKQALEVAEKLSKDQQVHLEDERRKIEDLQFRIEEESIIRSDLEAQFENYKDRVKTLEKLLQEKCQPSDEFSKDQEKEQKALLEKQLEKQQLDEIDMLKKELIESNELNQKVTSEKLSLEQQLLQVKQSTGDSFQQLKLLSEEMKAKKKYIEDVEKSLKASADELHLQHKQEIERMKESHLQETKTWQLKVDTLHEEYENFKQAVRTEVELLKEQKNALVQEKDLEIESLKKEMVNYETTENELKRCLQEITKLKQTQYDNNSSLHNLEEENSKLQAKINCLIKEKDMALNESRKMQEKCTELSVQLEQLLKDKQEQQKAVYEREEQVSALNLEIERLQIEFSAHKKDLSQKLEESKIETEAMQKLHQELALQRDAVSELQKKLDAAESSRAALRQEATTLQSTLKGMTQECAIVEELKKRESELLSNFSCERETLQKALDANKGILHKKEEELSSLLEEVSLLKGKKEDSVKYLLMIETLEQEKKQLESKVLQLQVSTSHPQPNANITDSGTQKLKEEKESLESQVEFLNSIIVDMQKKNNDLISKINVLEMGDKLSEKDVNSNGLKTIVAPRLFCDICDMFDLHDTEDCPHQSTEDDEGNPPHSRYHGQRNQERPYCQTCEVFGHWDGECDNETY